MALLLMGTTFGVCAPGNDQQCASSFTLRADWFDRGNVRVSQPGDSYADEYACIWNAGKVPNCAEYDLEFPVTSEYAIEVLYAAASSRPVDILLDGRRVHRGLAAVTGSWKTSSAKWERQLMLRISAGKHSLKLHCPGPCMPHICAIRFVSTEPLPADWTFQRPIARQKLNAPVAAAPHAGLIVPQLPPASDVEQIRVVPTAELRRPRGSSFNELAMETNPVPVTAAESPWTVALELARASESGSNTLVHGLSPERIELVLSRTVELIRDFRTMAGIDGDYLLAEQRRCEELHKVVSRNRNSDVADGRVRLGKALVEGLALQRRVALSNPLLDFDRLLLLRRSTSSPRLGLPQNWQSNCVLPIHGFDDEITTLSLRDAEADLRTLYRPEGDHFVGDVDLHFDASRLLFSSIGDHDKWHVFEMDINGTGVRQVTPSEPDVDHYDACYLPDGGILFSSTAFMAAVPCVNGSTRVANLYRLERDGTTIRQLCFDQEHNWCPTTLQSGRVLYLRWEYTDTPHSHDRVLFSMNPDGTEQMEFYGSNSYWPNAMFYARPIPGRPSMFVAVVGGHHGVPRMGELVLFDARRGRRESSGAVQRIPGRGKRIESATAARYGSTLIDDQLVDQSWPKFLHPYPLSEKYFLVACQPNPAALWGIYLVDTFDNMVLLKEQPGYALLEPIPVRPTTRPPVIPSKVDLSRQDALVFLADVYEGGGLRGVPRGTVKQLRLISYHYLFPGMGGPQGVVGMEGPWDIKRIMGTVPVEPDGSAFFRIPSNTPVAVQPLDEDGKALQLMRSWFTGMPGEVVSCVGCHESQSSVPPVRLSAARQRSIREIQPWYGPARGFNFEREVQPVLDEYCIACHDGTSSGIGEEAFDLRGLEQITDYTSVYHFGGKDAGHFSTSYVALHRFVRRPGLESDYHMLMPMEFHADTTQLVQLLQKGHYNVELDEEAWDRLITWIDLNAPYHGTWTEIAGAARVAPLARRRKELLKKYANLESDPESEARPPARPQVAPVRLPVVEPQLALTPHLAGWPLTAAEAVQQQRLGPVSRELPLSDQVSMHFVRIPAGRFVMGAAEGDADAQPQCTVSIDKPFWMSTLEVTNRQFALFDAQHDSRVESRFAMQFGVRGFYVNGPDQPVVRISWRRAMEFCDWLSHRTGHRYCLPTEAQWEYACRAGTDTAFYFGDEQADFSPYANLADQMLSEFVCHPYKKQRVPYPQPSKYDDWIPKDNRFHDGGFLSEKGARYAPNPWGLFDVHGNVAEWTRSVYAPYPYVDGDGRNERYATGLRVARGGSWRDRPHRATSAFRLAYRPYQAVYNVGFRVVCEE